MKSNNVEDHALIIPNYFQDPEDLKPIIEGFKFGKKLAEAFGDGSVYQHGHFPGCTDHEIGKLLFILVLVLCTYFCTLFFKKVDAC